jgi:hypothetical protein
MLARISPKEEGEPDNPIEGFADEYLAQDSRRLLRGKQVIARVVPRRRILAGFP